MKLAQPVTLMIAALALSACEGAFDRKKDLTTDKGLDYKSLSSLKAGVWIDPNGCDHWIVDDGIEGYLSQRLGRDGKPVCSGSPLANHAIGGFKSGTTIEDPI